MADQKTSTGKVEMPITLLPGMEKMLGAKPDPGKAEQDAPGASTGEVQATPEVATQETPEELAKKADRQSKLAEKRIGELTGERNDAQAEAKKLREEFAAAQKELKVFREQQRLAKLSEMDDVERSAYLLSELEQQRAAPATESSEAKELLQEIREVKFRQELSESFNLSPDQINAIVKVKKEIPSLELKDALVLAGSRDPGLFTADTTPNAGLVRHPSQVVQQPQGELARQGGQQKDPYEEAVKAFEKAKDAGDRQAMDQAAKAALAVHLQRTPVPK